jgi:hypothetical protein
VVTSGRIAAGLDADADAGRGGALARSIQPSPVNLLQCHDVKAVCMALRTDRTSVE